MNCPICSGALRPHLQTKDHSRPSDVTVWEIGWCDECEFGRITNPVTPEQISGFYTSNYYTHSKPTVGPRQTFGDRIRAAIAWRLDKGAPIDPSEVSGRSMCDIGSGGGSLLRRFKAAGFEVFGVEPDPVARERTAKEFNVIHGTAEELPENVGRFDVVLMCHVLEHCNDPEAAITRSAAACSKNGTLVIEVPNNRAIGFSLLGAAWPWADIPRHLNFFSEKSLRALLIKCGLSIEKTYYVGYSRQFSREWIDEVRRLKGPRFWVWPLLLLTALAPPNRKYDAIRVHAVVT